MELLYQLEKIRTPLFDRIFQLFTFFGQELLVIAVICFLYWCYNKKLAYRVVFGYFLSGLLVQSLKITFRIPRPWVKNPSFQPVESAVEAATGYSFPSGHTQASTALYGSLAVSTKKKGLRAAGIVLFVVVGFSRMYLGVHTPWDVGVSMLLTFLIVLLTKWIFNREMTKRFMVVITVIMGVVSLVVLIYSLSLYHNGIIEEKYAMDCCVAASSGIMAAIGWYIECNFIQFTERSSSKAVTLIKYVCGLTVAAGLKYGLAAVIGKTILTKSITYAVLVAWIMIGYPLLLRKLCGRQEEA